MLIISEICRMYYYEARIVMNTSRYTHKKNSAKPNTFSENLGFRVIYTLLSVVVFGFCVNDSINSFMSSSVIYIVPLLKEYLSFKPNRKELILLHQLELWTLYIIISFIVLYYFNVLIDCSENGILYFSLNPEWVIYFDKKIRVFYIWVVHALTSFFVILDFFAYKSKNSTK